MSLDVGYLKPGYAPSFGGMDGSHYDIDAGPFHEASVKAISTDNWVAWKATQSTSYTDPTFRDMRKRLAAVGFQMRFFYHWLGSIKDPVEQARYYLSVMGAFASGEGTMIDAEEKGVTAEKVWLFAEAVEAVTHTPCSVYTGLYVADIWKSQRVRVSKYGLRPMHLAAYITISSLISRMRALGVIDLEMHAWQYSSAGVPGSVSRPDSGDCNDILNPTVYRAAAHLTAVPPAQPDTSKPPTQKETDDMTKFTNAEQRVSPADNQPYAPGKFVFVVEGGGKVRHVVGVEGKLYGDPAGQGWAQLSNADIDSLLASQPYS